MQKFSKNQIDFYRPLIKQYLSKSSVDSVFSHDFDNPGVSIPHFHRILRKWGIVKTAGPNTRLSHVLYFLCHMVKQKLPLETAYRLSPRWLKESTSMGTLHRILGLAKSGLTRRHGTALIVSLENEPSKVLIGQDVSSSSIALGKSFGSLSLPMTYSKLDEDPKISILRVLQREVLTDLALDQHPLEKYIPANPQSTFSIDIADVHVNIYRLTFPSNLAKHISSFKLQNLLFVPINNIAKELAIDSQYRSGVVEIIRTFVNLPTNLKQKPRILSLLNHSLALLAAK